MAGLADMTWGACVVPGTTLPATLTAEVRRGMGAVPGRLLDAC